MVMVMLMAGNKKVIGHFEETSHMLHLMGWIATVVMAVAALMIFVTWHA
jgi:hypothetical protein